jgi:2-keto-4-pentenoate hydratase/2-oxohepta-3-ene-1,7-dioic acid hydratase in catechol pathway
MCVGKNYSEHAREFARSGYEAGAVAGKDIDDFPALFSKLPSSVTAQGREIELHPAITQKVDYEAELAVIIGKGGRGISKADAYSISGAIRSSMTSPPGISRRTTSSGSSVSLSTHSLRWGRSP